jgi:hypothetical protein
MAANFVSMAANGSGCHKSLDHTFPVAVSPRRNVRVFSRIADHGSYRGDLDRESGKEESANSAVRCRRSVPRLADIRETVRPHRSYQMFQYLRTIGYKAWIEDTNGNEIEESKECAAPHRA